MKNKVLLVTSNFEDIPISQTKTPEESHYPVGLAYLHSYLESKKIDTKILCLNNQNYDCCFKEVLNKIKNFSPDIIGFQLLTSNRVSSYRLIEYIHKEYPEIKIVIGGIHTTIMYKQLIKTYPFLIAVLGEGEITFVELIEELNKKKINLKKINGVAFWSRGAVTRTPPRELIKDLDTLPFPKHELFFKNPKRYSGCLLTSRGCPFSCSFCCLNPEAKRIVRFRSPENVVDEIEHMINTLPQITEIFIHDDSFFVSNERVIKICDEIVKRKIKMDFVCSGRIKPISKEMIKKLEEAGFSRVLVGMESGDNGILKSCHKGINQEDVVNCFKLFSKSKINLKTFLIVGLPGETIGTINETLRFIKKLQRIKYTSYSKYPNLLMVYPGTEVYDIAKSKGMVSDEFWLSDKEIPVYTAENSYAQLKIFGELLANNLSFSRMSTWRGFVAQFEMIPYIIIYGFKKIIQILKNKKIN